MSGPTNGDDAWVTSTWWNTHHQDAWKKGEWPPPNTGAGIWITDATSPLAAGYPAGEAWGATDFFTQSYSMVRQTILPPSFLARDLSPLSHKRCRPPPNTHRATSTPHLTPHEINRIHHHPATPQNWVNADSLGSGADVIAILPRKVVASLAGNAMPKPTVDKVVLFKYEKGAALKGGAPSPALRIGFPPYVSAPAKLLE